MCKVYCGSCEGVKSKRGAVRIQKNGVYKWVCAECVMKNDRNIIYDSIFTDDHADWVGYIDIEFIPDEVEKLLSVESVGNNGTE